MLRGCAARGLALPTVRGAGRRSAICRTPRASPATRSLYALSTGCRPERGPVITVGPSRRWLLWDERLQEFPLIVAQRRSFREARGGFRPGAIIGPSFSQESVFGGSARFPTTFGYGLVRSPPCRPPQSEAPFSLIRLGHGEQQAPYLRHRQPDQAGIGIPFLPLVSSRPAAERVTTRKA